MKRVRHHIFMACSALSLLVCVAAAAPGWVQSYAKPWQWAWSDGVPRTAAGYRVGRHESVGSVKGQVFYAVDHSRPDSQAYSRRHFPGTTDMVFNPRPAPDTSTGLQFAGFEYTKRTGYPLHASRAIGPPAEMLRYYAVPYWAVVLATAIAPAAWVLGWVKRRRATRAGRCVRCGYDLRASPQRCPECGEPAAVGEEVLA